MEIRWHWSPFTLGKGAQGKRSATVWEGKGGKKPNCVQENTPQITTPLLSWVLTPRPCCVGHKQGQWMPQEPPALGGEAKPL